MNETIFQRIRRVFDPELAHLGAGRSLDGEVVGTLHALLQVLADDPDLPRADVERTLQRRAARDLAHGREYVSGARLLDAAAQSLLGRAFADCDLERRDEVLKGLLGEGFPSPELESPMLRRLRLTSYNLHLVLSSTTLRRFRKFVVADLLSYYYTTGRGWAVVGYREYPGFVRTEAAPCEVRSVRMEGRQLFLDLSDACTEPLRPDKLRVDDLGRFVCETKSGRQMAVFTRDAQRALGELLEESPDGSTFRVAGTSCEVDLGDGAR